MAHLRQSIREAVATAVTGLATTGSRVFQSRMREQDSLPCLLVTTEEERVDSSLQSVQERQLAVRVTGVAKSVSGVDDTLDTIANEVEAAVQSAGTLGGLLGGTMLLTRTGISFDDSLEQPVGEVQLDFAAIYFTNAGAPGSTVP